MHIQEVFNAIYSNHFYEYFVIDRTFKVIEYSDKVFDFCDKELMERENSDIFLLVPELFGLEDALLDIFDGKSKMHKVPYIAKNNNHYVNIYLYPGRKDKDKKYESVIVLFEDITKIALAQQQLLQEKNENILLVKEISVKNAQLEEYNNHMQELVKAEIQKNLEKQKMLELQARYSQMGEIIGMITHQWKQPLNAISMMVNVLKLKQHNGTISTQLLNEKLDDILMQVGYMSQTVNDFQHFFNPIKERIYFNAYNSIQSVLELVKSEYFHKNINVILSGDKKLQVVGMPNELNQVILSILKNAKDEFVKHPHEHMEIRIDISAKDDKGIITVTDNAGGIPEDIIDKIFDIYISTKKDGSGLGLNISKNMIEDHMNGKIYVKNVENGAKFTIELPTSLPE